MPNPVSTAKRPYLPKADPEMQRWCADIIDEVCTWRDVTTKPMFGMSGLCRGGKMFAALPRTRAADTPFSMLIKLPGVEDERLAAASGPGAGWVTFDMQSSEDINEALRWLEQAYRKASRSSAAPHGRPQKQKGRG